MHISARYLGLLSTLIVLAIAGGLGAAERPGDVPLPIRKVMLYKNGVGYFEHLGEVRGAAPVDITFSSAQLNDVLKSLTVLDLAPAPLGSVTYDSTKPTDRQLAELPVKLGNFSGLAGFLNEIRGTEIELDMPGGLVAGRLMTAEMRKKELGSGATADVVDVTLYGAGGQRKRRCGRRPIGSCSTTSASRCCRGGPSSTTPAGWTGTVWSSG